jgi:hypothetical protein
VLEQGVDRQRRRVAVDAHGLHPQHFEPTDIGEGIADVVISQSKTVAALDDLETIAALESSL